LKILHVTGQARNRAFALAKLLLVTMPRWQAADELAILDAYKLENLVQL